MPVLATNPCSPDQWSCTVTWQVTGSEQAATFVNTFIARFGSILLLTLTVLVARWFLHRLIDRFVRRSEAGWLPGRVTRLSLGSTSLADAMGLSDPAYQQRRVARARTVGSLIKSITSMVLFSLLVVMAIAELGFSIAPIVASAGVVGVALSFGAQSLVKDFLSGLFIILEDQYGVGDVISLGDPVVGTVEAVSLRVTRLRDDTGIVWYVRNGEILRVGNKSQNWSRAMVDVGVAYDEDLDRVRRVLEEVADELWTEEGPLGVLLESPDVVGIETVAPDVVTMRVMLKTQPNQQVALARRFRDQVKSRFAEDGISVGPPPP